MPTATALSFPAPGQRLLPAGFDPADEAGLARALADLLARPLGSRAELLAWLADVDELDSAIDALAARAAVASTRNTEDLAARARHLDIQSRVLPQARRGLDALDRKYLACPLRPELGNAYAVFERLKTNHAALYREANVALEAEESRLTLQYDERMGSLVVPFRGETHTPQAMARYLDETDRDVREQAWLAQKRARLGAADEISTLFEQLLHLRRELAGNAGFSSYRDFRFRQLDRFDYGAADCETFHIAVEEQIVPVVSELREQRRRSLGVDRLRPWDLAVDPAGRPPLRLFRNAEELAALGEHLLTRVDPELGEQFAFLRERKLLDLDNRRGKAPGGYNQMLEDVRLPFIFANAVGVLADVKTLLHEAGHAFHSLAARDQPLRNYRHAPMEFAEVASMSMELLGAEQFAGVLSRDEAARARRAQLERSLEILPWVATVDAFQHWIYTYPEHGREERAAYWRSLRRRFEPDVDWSGHEDWLDLQWQSQLHIVKLPFYYIEYGIAQIGALQVWLNVRNKGRPALAAYRAALALGGSRPLPELFTAAHICFEFNAAMLQTLAVAVVAALDETAAAPTASVP